MRDLLDDIDRWRTAGKRVALARVVDIEGSGPRDPGAAMAVSEDGEVAQRQRRLRRGRRGRRSPRDPAR
jgi:xanthine/CO dehydrogenase XdhC/CoxF family maturation factor